MGISNGLDEFIEPYYRMIQTSLAIIVKSFAVFTFGVILCSVIGLRSALSYISDDTKH